MEKHFMALLKLKCLGGIAENLKQLVRLPGLEKKTVGVAAVDGVNDIFQVRVAGHEQPERLGVLPLDPLEKLDPGHAGHLLIAKDEVDRAGCEDGNRLLGGRRRGDLEFALQQARQRAE